MTDKPESSLDVREAIVSRLTSELGDSYDCTRVWDAWHVGTMSQDDFVPLSERVEEIADGILEVLAAAPSEPPALGAPPTAALASPPAQPQPQGVHTATIPTSRTDIEWQRLPEIRAKFLGYFDDPTDANALRIIEACRNRFAAAAPAGSIAEPVAWNPMETAPTDGTIVRLLVDYTDGDHPLEDAAQAQTIGGNTDGNTGDNQGWKFAGWNWTQDHFTEGRGNPIGWLPFDAPRQTTEPCKTCGGYGYARGSVCWGCAGSGRNAATPQVKGEADAVDAERWRYMRDGALTNRAATVAMWESNTREELDAAVDAAMKGPSA